MYKRMLVDLCTCQITEFEKDIFRIGIDGGEADFHINNISISRVHCDILTREDKFYIVDRNSTNGTSVNGTPLQPGLEHPLNSDDVIRIGSAQYLFLALRMEGA